MTLHLLLFFSHLDYNSELSMPFTLTTANTKHGPLIVSVVNIIVMPSCINSI